MQALWHERKQGWPRGVALVCLLTAAAFGFLEEWIGLVFSTGLGLFLLSWRRGVLIEPEVLLMTHWWGLRLPLLGLLRIRDFGEASLKGLDAVAVETLERGQHYKARAMFRVVLLEAGDPLHRVVVDDEFDTQNAADRMAEAVKATLQL